MNRLIGGLVVTNDDPDNPSLNTANAGNANLVPELSRTLNVSLEYYTKYTGLISVSAYRRDLKNLIRRVTCQIPAGGSFNGEPRPSTISSEDWLINTVGNVANAPMSSIEFAVTQQLSFLPGPSQGSPAPLAPMVPAGFLRTAFFVARRGGPATLTRMLQTCQAGFESLLVRELADAGVAVAEHGPGWVAAPEHAEVGEMAFPHVTLRAALELKGESVNALAQQIADFFLASLRGERIDAAWPCVFGGPAELVGLGRRMSSIEKAFYELLKKKLARVAKLAVADLPRGAGSARGLFVWFTDFGRLFVAREAWIHGQRRMADDDAAPSRSYLKVEEAFVVLGREPQPGESVVDLGAAPGGWSYSAAKRGARVIAVDNGPLKGGALGHPNIEHRAEDAFHFNFEAGAAYDWMFCDLLEEPHHVMKNLIEPWLARGWCKFFVFNLKFGHVDSVALLRELREPGSPLARYAPGAQIRHLYHDREEFTVVGEVTAS